MLAACADGHLRECQELGACRAVGGLDGEAVNQSRNELGEIRGIHGAR